MCQIAKSGTAPTRADTASVKIKPLAELSEKASE